MAGFYTGGSNTMTLSTLGTGATIAVNWYMQGQDCDTGYAQETPGVNSWTGQAYGSFKAAIETAFNATGTGTWTASFSTTTGLWSLSKSGGAVALDFETGSIPANLRLMRALGFASSLGAATTFQATRVPDYAIFSAITGRTNVQGPYEPDDIAEEAVSDGGVDYVITRKTGEQLISWEQQMEPLASVDPFTRSLDYTPEWWTWRDWFQHVRGTHPFVVLNSIDGDASVGGFYRYTAKGAAYKPRRFTADFNDYWVVPHDCRWLAALEAP